ncbi:MAG: TonB-dependent receptor [Ignavibacteriae bacterium]|nr:TonB-dependent receptor [Ignavibacteriota bacterium]
MKRIYIYILFFCFTSPLFAQPDNDSSQYKTETINIFGNRTESNLLESPVSVTLINRKSISNMNGTNLADVLQNAGGVFIKSYGGNSSLQTISMNGLGAEHTLILLNGNRINSYQNSQFDLSMITKDNIESVEILNNGYSAAFGSEAFSGVLNIVTKGFGAADLGSKFSADIKSEFGSYNFRKYGASVSKGFGRMNFRAFYEQENSDDNFDYYYDNGVYEQKKQRRNSSFSQKNFNVILNYSPDKLLKYSFISAYTDNSRNLPGIEAGSEPSAAYQLDRNWNNLFTIEKEFSGKRKLNTAFGFQNNYMKYSSDPGGNSFYRNIVVSGKAVYDFRLGNNKTAVGTEINYAVLNSNNTEDFNGRFQTAVYMSSEIPVSKQLFVFPSLRYENTSDAGKQAFLGRIGINYRIIRGKNIFLRSTLGNSYRVPSFNELYWKTGGNKNLKPEQSVNFDAGLIYNLFLFADYTLEVKYLNINAVNKIIWKPGSSYYWTPENISSSKSEVYSVDFKTKKIFSDKLSLSLNFNYTYNKSVKKSEDFPSDPSAGKQLIYIPLEMSKIGVEAEVYGLGINIFYIYNGKRYKDYENTAYLPAVNLVNGNLSYDFIFKSFGFNAKFELNNILGENYQVIAGYPMPLRNYKISLTIKY